MSVVDDLWLKEGEMGGSRNPESGVQEVKSKYTNQEKIRIVLEGLNGEVDL